MSPSAIPSALSRSGVASLHLLRLCAYQCIGAAARTLLATSARCGQLLLTIPAHKMDARDVRKGQAQRCHRRLSRRCKPQAPQSSEPATSISWLHCIVYRFHSQQRKRKPQQISEPALARVKPCQISSKPLACCSWNHAESVDTRRPRQ